MSSPEINDFRIGGSSNELLLLSSDIYVSFFVSNAIVILAIPSEPWLRTLDVSFVCRGPDAWRFE